MGGGMPPFIANTVANMSGGDFEAKEALTRLWQQGGNRAIQQANKLGINASTVNALYAASGRDASKMLDALNALEGGNKHR